MRKAGEVIYADIDRNGDGIVEFADKYAMEDAIKQYNGTEYKGERLTIMEVRVSFIGHLIREYFIDLVVFAL